VRALAMRLVLGLCVAGAAAADPHVDYMIECQGCHLPDGSGKPGAVPTLRDSMGRFVEVPGGRAFLVQVPGSAMSPLSDARLAAVLNWMIREFGPEDAARRLRPYDAAEVAVWRSKPLVDVEATRAALIASMSAH
jgi:mono/diheme cytochrome c family protein